MSYYRTCGDRDSARLHEQRLQKIDSILALERKGAVPEAASPPASRGGTT
jgi:hypothetical protein